MQFVSKLIWRIVRILASRVFILIFMIGLLVASHTISFIASATITAIASASRLVTSQPFVPKSVTGLQAQNRQLRNNTAANNRLVTQQLTRVQNRTRRTAIANVAAAGGEALPFIGVGVIAAATVYEVKNSCDTMHDLYDMQVAIDPTQANPEDMDSVCGLQVPTKDELWAAVKNAPGAAWDRAVKTAEGTADWASSLERPDFGGLWQRMMTSVGDWL